LRLLEKATANQPLDPASFFNRAAPFSFTGLRFGCLMVGLGMLTSFFFLCNGSMFDHKTGAYWLNNGTLTFACLLTFGGIGLLVAYFIEQKSQKK
jgi:hypothetical protein